MDWFFFFLQILLLCFAFVAGPGREAGRFWLLLGILTSVWYFGVGGAKADEIPPDEEYLVYRLGEYGPSVYVFRPKDVINFKCVFVQANKEGGLSCFPYFWKDEVQEVEPDDN